MTNRTYSIIVLAMACAGVVAAPAAAQSSVERDRSLKAYGSRVGDRDMDANNTRVIGNRRLDSRIDLRLDSRLRTRIDRFALPTDDEKTAYTPKVEDGTKTGR